MSDDFAWIVDLDATDEDATALGARVLAWLIENGAVAAVAKDCVPHGMGFPPGPRMAEWLGDPDLASQILRQKLNGLAVMTGREVYMSYEEPDEEYRATCPAGHDQTPPLDWLEAVEGWAAGGDPELECCVCESPYPVDRWLIEPDFALVRLGFVFWNWVELSDELIESVTALLAPHRVVAGVGAI